MLYTLIYVSKATKWMDADDLHRLLKEAMTVNDEHDITGMLLYIEGKFHNTIGGRFIQVLEGQKADVEFIYEKIKVDSRHHHVNLLSESDIEKRNFKNWSMGFKTLKLDDFRKTSGYFDLDGFKNLSLNPKAFNAPMMYLKSFYDMQ